jgi:hypothetical protein
MAVGSTKLFWASLEIAVWVGSPVNVTEFGKALALYTIVLWSMCAVPPLNSLTTMSPRDPATEASFSQTFVTVISSNIRS